MADNNRSHRYFIEGGNRVFVGKAELLGTYGADDKSASQGQSATQTTAITTFLTAANTLAGVLGDLGEIKLTPVTTATEGKITGL